MASLKGKRVFVSGGAGVIGHALIERLVKEGAEILVGDLKPRPSYWPASIRYRQGDLNQATARELDAFKPEYFFHLAATFERSVETPEFWGENFQHNVRLSHHLMTLLKDSPSLKKVIFASSYLIYDPVQYSFKEAQEKAHRLREKDPIYPRNLCGAAKLLHEIELDFLAHFSKSKLQVVSARIFRSYGKHSRDVISRWVRALLRDETINVFKLEGLFDYVYADEVAEGLFRMASSEVTGIVNLGNDNARRVSDVVATLKKHFPGLKAIPGESDIAYEASQANMDQTEKLLGWKPKRQLEDVIPELIEFEKRHGYGDPAATPTAAAAAEARPPRVLVTSVSRKVPLLRELRSALNKLTDRGSIVGGDLDERCIGRHFTDSFWKMPRLSELSREDLAAYCKREGITAIVPTRDGELPYFSGHREFLARNGVQVMASSAKATEACLDKLAFARKLGELGLPAIPTFDSLRDAEATGSATFVVKERYGAGSLQIGLDLDRAQAADWAKGLKDPIFQPFVKGVELSVDVYVARDGKAKGAIARTRDLIVSGESQVTTTRRDADLEGLCLRAAEKLGLYGHAVFQLIVDSSGKAQLIECNSRFGGASSLSVAAGLDSFYWFLLESQGQDVSDYPFARVNGELKQIRFAEDRILPV